jgi:hypothetical protein
MAKSARAAVTALCVTTLFLAEDEMKKRADEARKKPENPACGPPFGRSRQYRPSAARVGNPFI